MPEIADMKSYKPPRRLRTVGLVALAVAGGVVAFGMISRVKADQRVATWTNQQMVADIDTPDLDQQLEAAKADLVTAQANEELSQTTATRWAALLTRNAVSRQ